MQNIISLDTEELARRGFQHEGPPPTHTLEKHGGAGSPAPWGPGPLPPWGPDTYELLKTPHRLVRSQYCGIVWVKEEGSWRDLEICASPKVEGRKPPSAPPFLESGGATAPPLPPLFLHLWILYHTRFTSPWKFPWNETNCTGHYSQQTFRIPYSEVRASSVVNSEQQLQGDSI